MSVEIVRVGPGAADLFDHVAGQALIYVFKS